MSEDPRLTEVAEQKLEQLLQQYPKADVAGVFVRIGEYGVVLTREGRIEWFEQNSLGGIRKDPEPDTRTPVEVMAEINARHQK